MDQYNDIMDQLDNILKQLDDLLIMLKQVQYDLDDMLRLLDEFSKGWLKNFKFNLVIKKFINKHLYKYKWGVEKW